MKRIINVAAFILLLTACEQGTTPLAPVVSITGEMRNVMHKGELFGTIDLDTLSNRSHLYGLGPLEYLKGEILILDGKSYVSKVVNDSTMQVAESYKAKAPFLVYSNVEQWFEKRVPDSVRTLHDLELFLDAITKDKSRPFAFKIFASVDSSLIHIVNLPEGTQVHTPEEAHREQKTYSLKNTVVDIIGFFSTEHAGVFTHHDSFVHMHLITSDKTKMGHVDQLTLKEEQFVLYLPFKL